MIPKRYITQWGASVPWGIEAQVEQDLLLSRALIELFNNKELSETLLFRGGTALNKIFIQPASRYSEDIDLVQRKAEPIGKTIDLIKEILSPLLGKASVSRGEGRASVIYRFESEFEPKIPMRLKIEINTREHYNFLPIEHKEFIMSSGWFSGKAILPTYHLNELAATKLRALYQRKKGRDLYDMVLFLKQPQFNALDVIAIFQFYLNKENKTISRAEYEANLFNKMSSELFLRDMDPLLSSDQNWDVREAYELVTGELVSLLPGNPWRGIAP